MGLLGALVEAVGEAQVERPEHGLRDVCRFDLGCPIAVVSPQSTEQVQRVVQAARAHGTKLVTVGERTAYWRPLHLEGAVGLSVRRLRGFRREGGAVVLGAGEPVRPLDARLRSLGAHLPLHPDAFGETSVGAMVAMGCTSGIGMGRGGIGRWLTGLTVVDGRGEVCGVGAASAWAGNPPFMAEGQCDAMSAFVGSEGTLGVITEVALRWAPTPWRVRVSARVEAALPLLELAQEAGQRELVDTFRLLRERDRHRGAEPGGPWRLDVWVSSSLSAEEADLRARWLVEQLRRRHGVQPTVQAEGEAARLGRSPDYDARYDGPMDQHLELASRMLLIGLDVNAPYEAAPALAALADEVADAQGAMGAPMVRTAFYLAPDFVNLGMHTSFPTDEQTVSLARADQQRWLARLAELPVIPYRLGRIWPEAMHARRTAAHRAWLAACKAYHDPDGVLQPGHGLHGPR